MLDLRNTLVCPSTGAGASVTPVPYFVTAASEGLRVRP